MHSRDETGDVENDEWRPVATGPVPTWAGHSDVADDESLVADLDTFGDRLVTLWRDAWRAEYDAGTAFVVAPVAFAIGIVAYFAMPLEPARWASLAPLVIVVALVRGRYGVSRVALVALALALAGFTASKWRVERLATVTVERPTVGWLVGTVERTERRADGRVRYTLRVDSFETERQVSKPTRVRVTVRKEHAPLTPGTRSRQRVRLVPPSGPAFPGGYDFSFHAWFDGRGADGIGFSTPEAVGSATGVDYALAAWRDALGQRIASGMDERTGPLARALVTGDRSGIDETLNESLRVSGLAHILAISGLHMMLVTGLVFATIRRTCAVLSLRSQDWPVKKIAALGALGFGAVYLLLSGLNVSTQRAFVMVCVMLIAVLLDRRALTLHNVAIAAFIVLILQPEALFSPGFQMSFGAATALVSAYGTLRRRKRAERERTAATGTLRWLVGFSATSLVAGFATAPFAAFHFHRIAAYGMVANLLAMPIVTFAVMPLVVVAVLAMPFGADPLVLPLLGWALDAVLVVSDHVAGWDGWMRTGQVGPATLALAAIAFCLLTLLRSWLRLFGLPFAAAALLIYATSSVPSVLLHEDGRHAAVIGPDEITFFAGRETSFVNRLFREAFVTTTGVRTRKAHCDTFGCATRRTGGPTVVVSRQPGSLPDDCAVADIVVTNSPTACKALGHPNVMTIDRRTLTKNGSIAVYDRGPSHTGPSRWRIVRTHDRLRPWTIHRAER